MNKFYYILILCSLFFMGCESLNQIISPEMQCTLLRQTGKIGIEYGLNREILSENDLKYYQKGIMIIKDKIIPQIQGLKEKEDITKKDLDFVLDELNANLKTEEKALFQLGLNTIISWMPQVNSINSVVPKSIISNFLCLLEGVLAGFSKKIEGIDASTLNLSFEEIEMQSEKFKISWSNE